MFKFFKSQTIHSLCVGLALGALTSTALAQETVKIGVLAPLTGVTASDGGWLMKGHELAVEEINARGGIRSLNGAKVQLVVAERIGNSTA